MAIMRGCTFAMCTAVCALLMLRCEAPPPPGGGGGGGGPPGRGGGGGGGGGGGRDSGRDDRDQGRGGSSGGRDNGRDDRGGSRGGGGPSGRPNDRDNQGGRGGGSSGGPSRGGGGGPSRDQKSNGGGPPGGSRGGYSSKDFHHNSYRGDRPQLDDDTLKTLKQNWQRCQNGKCKERGDRQRKTRDAIKQNLRRPFPGGPGGGGHGGGPQWKGFDDTTIERRFKKAYQIKKQLFTLNGLDMEPHDDGLIGGDMLFNEQQLDRMLKRTEGVVDTAASGDVPLLDPDSVLISPLNGTETRQKRADTLALDYYGGNKWPSTSINFYIDPKDFTTAQANVIRTALKSIQSTSCLKFVEVNKSPVMEFVKAPSNTDDGTCGWADVGYQGDYNSVNINFQSTICKSTLQGVVIHETLHSLGFVHEHTRYDRDNYLKIDWTNVDPQSTDVFTVDDPHDHNPYCVTFDPLSIMHYDPYVGALDSNKPVMSPKTYTDFYLKRMGQGNTMAASDITLLNKMYCKASTCKDKSTNCGWTACNQCTTYKSVCPKSCNIC